jgi:hypothetical protein
MHVKLKYEDSLKGDTKNKTFFLLEPTCTYLQKFICQSTHQKLIIFLKTYLKPSFIIWNLKINGH